MPEQTTATDGRPTTKFQPPVVSDDDALRAEALNEIRRERAFKLQVAGSTITILLVAAIWAATEYHNSGGWPHHFSQSSGTPGTWNDWIIWPAIAWVVFLSFRSYAFFFRRAPSEAEISRAMERLRRAP